MQPASLSERRLAANRANALKSTGPRTLEGKHRSSQNACRHRIYARTHTLAPRFESFLRDRAQRCTAAIQDPVLRALRFEFFMAFGFEEIVWANQDSLYNFWLTECQGDHYEANLNYYSSESHLEAFHRFHAHHARRMNAILKALIRYDRFIAKRRGLPCENPQALAEALIQAALHRTRQPSLNPPQIQTPAPQHDQTQSANPQPPAPLPVSLNQTRSNPMQPLPAAPRCRVIAFPVHPARPAGRNQTQSNPPRRAHPRRNNVICISRAKAPPPYSRQAA